MISFFKKIKYQAGMTYIELIVVLGIFAVMSTVILFNYKDFGRQIDLQNLSQDIALQIVQAQKIALSGRQPNVLTAGYTAISANQNWKPAYGVYFNVNNITCALANPCATPYQFIPFIDADNTELYDQSSCSSNPNNPDYECMDVIQIGKGNKISGLCVADATECDDFNTLPINTVTLSIAFTRPDSSAVIIDQNGYTYTNKAVISISDQDGTFVKHITVYASGRVETD